MSEEYRARAGDATSTGARLPDRVLSVDEVLDRMEQRREEEQRRLVMRFGKGIVEDKPEEPGITSTSQFNRGKLCDFEPGYF